MTDIDFPLVLIHGLLDDGRMWDHQRKHLAGEAAILTPDLLTQSTIGEAADAVLDSVTGNFAVAGFSMGGYVALELLRRVPSRICRLALIGTSARPDTPARTAQRNSAIALAQSGQFESLLDEVLPAVVHPSRLGDEVLMSSLRDMARRVGPDAFIRQQQLIMSRPDSRADLGRVDCPTLILCGRQDTLIPPEHSMEMADEIPGARLVFLDECNHYASLERPWAVTALLQQWLKYS